MARILNSSRGVSNSFFASGSPISYLLFNKTPIFSAIPYNKFCFQSRTFASTAPSMTFMDTLRGNGLAKAHRALAGLEEDPQRLHHARGRFDEPPPSYDSEESGASTRSVSPNPPSKEQQRRQEQQVQLGLERNASLPYYQFEHQTSDEEKRILEADRNGTCRVSFGEEYAEIAYKNVKERWVEQGIWSSKWTKYASGRWKHEEPLELELESDSDVNSITEPYRKLSFLPEQPRAKLKRQKTENTKQQIEKQKIKLAREREASRPYHQFIYQMSKQREILQDRHIAMNGSNPSIPDIDAMAYQDVKNTWTKRGIWNKSWGTLPGMSWKHEEPIEKEGSDSSAL